MQIMQDEMKKQKANMLRQEQLVETLRFEFRKLQESEVQN